MKRSYYSILIIVGLIGMFSCSKDDYDLNKVVNQRSELRALLEPDSLPSDSIITPLVVNPNSIKKPLTRALSSLNEDEYFSSNMWAIRDMPFTLQARGSANTSNKYLSANGKGREITLSGTNSTDAQKFYVKVLPASSGIPYLIYSYQTRTPLSVGQNKSNPDRKVLFALNDESGSLYSASWDIIPATNYRGYYTIQSESYIGQGSSGNWMDIFYYVVEIQNDNKVGFAKYQQSPKQEFIITPSASFTLKDITFDVNSANITEQTPLKIVTTGRNESIEQKTFEIQVNKTVNEMSLFSENKTLAFNLANSSKTYQRPTVVAGRLVLPETGTMFDATYRTSNSSTEYIPKNLLFYVRGDAPERSLIEVTSYIKNYVININYTAKAIFNDREIILSGVWRGTVYLGSNISTPNHVIRFFDLETGDEIIFTRSVRKMNTK